MRDILFKSPKRRLGGCSRRGRQRKSNPCLTGGNITLDAVTNISTLSYCKGLHLVATVCTRIPNPLNKIFGPSIYTDFHEYEPSDKS